MRVVEARPIALAAYRPLIKSISKSGWELMHFLGGNSASDNRPDFAKLNYLNLNTNNISQSGYQNAMGSGSAVDLYADFMFGKKKKVGFAVRLAYTFQSSVAHMDSLHLEYEVQNPNPAVGGSFLRYNNTYNINEQYGSNNLGVQLLFKYLKEPAAFPKLGYYIQFGPGYYFYNSTRSTYTATADKLADYHYSNGGWTYVSSAQQGDWLMTKAFLQAHPSYTGSDPTGSNIQAKNNLGYDVSVNQQLNGTSGKYRFAVALGGILEGGIVIKLSQAWQFTAGGELGFVYDSGNNKYGQSLSDANYNSLLNAVNQMLKIQYGINVGLRVKGR